MRAEELRQKTSSELQKELMELRQEQFKLRMQASAGQLSQTHMMKQVRRNIARVKTILRQKVGA